nr:unnamed protein product [Callosobruchus chinensis]
MGSSHSALNFGAGPAKLPRSVLTEVQNEFLSYKDSGMSLIEMSHRSKEYDDINNSAQKLIRELLNVPSNYKIIFMQGGGLGCFSAICMNLMGRTGEADYLVTGTWSSTAAKEGAKYGKVNMVFPKPETRSIPDPSTWKLSENASFVYYCDNETVDGVEFNYVPETGDVPLVADMSSNIMTKKVDVSKYGVIFAGAQKNIGPSGVVMVIVREDLLGNATKTCPTVFDFAHISKNNSVHHTPTTFAVYVMEKVLQWIKASGGVDKMAENSYQKSTILYDAIKNSNNFYVCPIAESCRSRINIPFRVGGPTGDEALEAKFLEEAEKLLMYQLKGHRSVGGIRASLYNATSVDDVKLLVQFMEGFRKQHTK